MTLEIHEHYDLTNANKPNIRHSHAGGSEPHQHPKCGPAVYEPRRQIGIRKPRKPKMTAKPTGPQLPWKELEEWQRSFKVVVCDPTPPEWGEGPGIALPLRIHETFRIPFTVHDGTTRKS